MSDYIQKNLGLRIQIPDEILSEIHLLSQEHYPKEFGGIFIGRIDDTTNTAIIEKIIVPEKYKSTFIYFKRFSMNLNKELSNIFEEYKGEMIYLGEWHSHPDGLAVPSLKDKKTMSKISENKNTRTESPLLLITSINKNSYEQIFYIYYQDQLYQYAEIN